MARLSARYQIGGRLGGGGMAEVMQGTVHGAEGFARPVAIKRVRPELSADPSFGAMFISEARLASLLHHPNVVSVLDFDRDEDGSYFLVMELVQGVDLRTLIDTGRLPPAVCAHIAAEVLRGLSYAHELLHQGRHLGIIHRDISPHNVMLSWDGSVKLVDFGIAKAVRQTGASVPGALKGKAAYMSPEQANGHPLDGRSDLFSTGVVFHEMLTGRRLFQGDTDPEILSRLLHQPIAPAHEIDPDVPADLSAIAHTLLEREPRRRYRSARRALEALLRSPSMTPAGALDLQEILRARFPDQAPRIPTAVREPPPSAPSHAPAPRPATPRPAVTPRTLTAGPETTGDPAPRRTKSTWWIAGGAGFLLAAAVVLYAALASSSGDTPTPETTSTPTLPSLTPAPTHAPEPTPAPAPAPDPTTDPDTAPPPDPDPTPKKTKTKTRTKPKPEAEPATPAAPGKLEIFVKPWATVTIDGTPYGTTPVDVDLPAGEHEITLANPELDQRETLTITVDPDAPKTVRRSWSP